MVELARDLLRFVGANKKFWMIPLFAVLLLLAGLIVLGQGSVVAPFIYTLF